MEKTKAPVRTFCDSEYAPLKQVILCHPKYMTIREIINNTQKHFTEDNINTEYALKQHESLIQTLESLDVLVILLPPNEHLPEQVFTRDIGFTLGHKLFISKMERKIRQGEEKVLKDWLEREKVEYTSMGEGSIEGGDVIIDRGTVWIGDSGRTSIKAIDEVKSLLPDFDVISVPFSEKYLHLDCVFNTLSPHEALIFSPAFRKKELERFASRYELIEVPAEEQFTLGTNVLSIGNRTVIGLPMNRSVNKELRRRGYTVVEANISEIIKSGGSFRCITLPLYRIPTPLSHISR